MQINYQLLWRALASGLQAIKKYFVFIREDKNTHPKNLHVFFSKKISLGDFVGYMCNYPHMLKYLLVPLICEIFH